MTFGLAGGRDGVGARARLPHVLRRPRRDGPPVHNPAGEIRSNAGTYGSTPVGT